MDVRLLSKIVFNVICCMCLFSFKCISPDMSISNKIVFERYDSSGPDYEIYIMNADGSDVKQITSNGIDDKYPSFSSDGTKILFVRGSGAASEIYIMNADGSNIQQITHLATDIDLPSFSPDGTKIVFFNNSAYDIYIMNTDGSNVVRLTSGFIDINPRFSLRPW